MQPNQSAPSQPSQLSAADSVKDSVKDSSTGSTSVHAPARVNLLGEHTDYTGGLVLPIAIPFSTRAVIVRREDDRYHFRSEQFEQGRDIARDDRSPALGEWSDYPVGVLRQLQQRAILPPAFELSLSGDVPNSAGLSSSASVEVASALALLAISGQTLPAAEIATLCRDAENQYVGSPCGIMDQFVIVGAKAGHAMLLDTRSLSFEQIPINQGSFKDTCVVVCNSMVKHSVATGEYGVRRQEVEEGQAVLLASFPALRDLGDATLEQLEASKSKMPETSYLRCRHIITENARVRAAKIAMLAGDAAAFGRLMLDAHRSERDDFACSCEEIDFLVDTASALPGCYGARLTGGGFGGCTVNLVERASVESFTKELQRSYTERFALSSEVYLCEAVDGALGGNVQTGEPAEIHPAKVRSAEAHA